MECLRPAGAKVGGADYWRLDRMEALITRSDRDSSSLFQYGAIAARGIITIARTPLMIGRCLGGRAADRIAEQEMATSGSAEGCRLGRAGRVGRKSEVRNVDGWTV